MTKTALDLLSVLRRSGPPYRLSTRELAEQTLVSAGAISQRVARAERDGLVRRRPSGHGRTELVELTVEGHELVERSLDRVLAADETAIARLADGDLDLLLDLLTRLGLDTAQGSSRAR